MTRSIKLWVEVAAIAIAITIMAVLSIAALMMHMFKVSPHSVIGIEIITSIFTTFFCVFVGLAEERRRDRDRDRANPSIQDELDSRKLRAQGSGIQFR